MVWSVQPTALREHPAQLDGEALAAIAEELAPAVVDAAPAIPAGERRGYVRISHTPSHEAWLIAWAPGSALEMHDHGDSLGAIHVVSGVLAESYVDRGRGRGEQAARMRTRELCAGATVAVPASRMHEVWNPGPHTTVSIHVYSPPLTSMTFYDRERSPRTSADTADRVSAIARMLQQARAGLDRVDPRDVHAEVANGAVLIDIRPASDRTAEGPMPGAIVIERIHLEWRLDPTSPDRLHIASPDLRVIVVCNEGYASSLAAHGLRRLGLARATDLAGGYRAWRALDPRS